MSKSPLFTFVAAILVITGVFAFTRQEDVDHTIVPSTTIATTTVVAEIPPVATVSTSRSSAATTSVTPTGPKATLKILQKNYDVGVTENETVLEMMKILATVKTISFTTHEYPSLGQFIDSINGQTNGGGKYWVYYVNGVDASVGVSNQIVHAGDVIEWKFENSY